MRCSPPHRAPPSPVSSADGGAEPRLACAQPTNATQPQLGESRIMRSLDGGVTWVKVANPPADVQTVVTHPSSPQVLFAGGGSSIYKTIDGGQIWRTTYEGQAAT